MNSRHSLHYIDLHPEPVRQDPPDWLIIIGAVAAAVGGTFLLICLMILPQLIRA